MAGYGIVLRDVFRRDDLTPEAKAIYGYLCSFAGSSGICYPSVELMRDELGMSDERYRKHFRMLLDTGIVKRSRKRVGNRLGGWTFYVSQDPEIQGLENAGLETENECQDHDFQGLEK